jgi:hypothetical protein
MKDFFSEMNGHFSEMKCAIIKGTCHGSMKGNCKTHAHVHIACYFQFKPQSQLAVRYWWSYVCCGFWWSWSLAGSARVTYVYRYGQLPVAIVVAIQQPPYVLTGTVRSIKIVSRPCVSRTIFTKKCPQTTRRSTYGELWLRLYVK